MSSLVTLLVIAVSLSMDTFSIALSLGTFGISQKRILLFSIIVGIFHFLFPIIGHLFGVKAITYLSINTNILLSIILLFIAVEMILDVLKTEEKTICFNLTNILLLASSVSLDSLSTGFGLSAITNSYYFSALLFAISAFLFTIMGFIIGKYSKEKLGIYAKVFGIILLFIIAILQLLKV